MTELHEGDPTAIAVRITDMLGEEVLVVLRVSPAAAT
jgi:hypothetical protein